MMGSNRDLRKLMVSYTRAGIYQPPEQQKGRRIAGGLNT
jgi:hypothetical protein